MKKILNVFIAFVILSFLVPINFAQASLGINIGTFPSLVMKYQKFEVPFTIGGVDYNTINPFNPNLSGTGTTYAYQKPGIKVDGYFRKSGAVDWIIQPAFYDGSGNWKLRFAAKEVGNWEYKILVKVGTQSGESLIKTFSVTDSENPGFLKVNTKDTRFFQFDNGQPFNPVGSAISGASGSTSPSMALDFMKANGMNYSRWFSNTGSQIEVMGTDSTAAKCTDLNNYNLARAATVDNLLTKAHQDGVYIQWVQEDSEKLKNRTTTQNTYIACGSPIATSAEEFFANTTAKEIYKRKLRYVLARWGYEANLMSIELINEALGGGTGMAPWHTEMADYFHNLNPYFRHMVTSSHGSEEMRAGGGIPWGLASIDYVNYHSYGKCTTPFSTGGKFDTPVERMGTTNTYPWLDSSIWADRIIRSYRGNSWATKPLTWTELGLALNQGADDWNDLYVADKAGRHVKDAIWAAALNGYVIDHWKLDYINGSGIYPPAKYSVFAPLANYLKGVNFEGMKQQTTYPIADTRNPSPTITSSNNNVFAVSMKGPDKAYLYVKNATNAWAQIGKTFINAECATSTLPSVTLPTASNQSAVITVAGLSNVTSGAYNLEAWSTTSAVAPTVTSCATGGAICSVASDGKININVQSLVVDAAYKILPAIVPEGEITINSTSDKTSALPGEIVNINNTIKNTKQVSATNLTVENVIPYLTVFGSASDGGIAATKAIACSEAANYGYPTCSLSTFNASIVRWSGITVAANASKTLSLSIKVPATPPPPPPPADTTKPNVSIISPTNGATVSGSISSEVKATDNVSVTQVEAFLDNVSLGISSISPYRLSLDTTKYTDGTHILTFLATDPSGNSGTASVQFNIKNNITPPPSSVIRVNISGSTSIEAEDARVLLTGKMIKGTSTSASGRQYVYIPDTSNKTNDNDGAAAYKLDATSATGSYYVWARVWWVNTSGNSLSFKVDNGTANVMTDYKYRSWHWIRLKRTLRLTGKNTLNIVEREDGSRLDKIVLTKSSRYRPY